MSTLYSIHIVWCTFINSWKSHWIQYSETPVDGQPFWTCWELPFPSGVLITSPQTVFVINRRSRNSPSLAEDIATLGYMCSCCIHADQLFLCIWLCTKWNNEIAEVLYKHVLPCYIWHNVFILLVRMYLKINLYKTRGEKPNIMALISYYVQRKLLYSHFDKVWSFQI